MLDQKNVDTLPKVYTTPTTRAYHGPERFSYLAWAWDVRKANEIVAGRRTSETVPTCSLTGQLDSISLTEEISAPVNCDIPLIAIRFGGDLGGIVIDGWHRIRDAEQNKRATLPVHVLSPEEEKSIRENGKDQIWNLLDYPNADLPHPFQKPHSRYGSHPPHPRNVCTRSECRRPKSDYLHKGFK